MSKGLSFLALMKAYFQITFKIRAVLQKDENPAENVDYHLRLFSRMYVMVIVI